VTPGEQFVGSLPRKTRFYDRNERRSYELTRATAARLIDDPTPPEIDIYAPEAGDIDLASELIDGNMARVLNSIMSSANGDGVSPGTAKMPIDWPERAIEYAGAGCPGVVALVPEENDVALAKVAAWREKDQDWLNKGVKAGVLLARANGEPSEPDAPAERRR
jgi:hypothetical protein